MKKAKSGFSLLDPLRDYPDMMSPRDVAEFAGISENAARTWVQRNGGVIVIKGEKRDTWRIHKELVRKALKLPDEVA